MLLQGRRASSMFHWCHFKNIVECMYTHGQSTHTLTYGTHTQFPHMWSVCLVSAYCRHLPFRLSALLLLPLFPSLVLFRLSTGSTDPWQATSTVCLSVFLSADQHKPWRHSLRSLTLMLFVPHTRLLSSSLSLSLLLCLLLSLFHPWLNDSQHCANLAKTHSGHDIVLTIMFRCQLRSFWWERVKINRG